jgi:hypothetical protein
MAERKEAAVTMQKGKWGNAELGDRAAVRRGAPLLPLHF